VPFSIARARRLVFTFAAFGVIDTLAKAALVGLFVNLCATDLVAAADHVYLGLLAAHQLTHDLVNEAILDQRFDSFGCLHGYVIKFCCMIPRGNI